jgi:putative transposase
VLRYVERNPVRPTMVRRAENWRWGSCHVRQHRSHELYPLLSEWPVQTPSNWLQIVNEPQSEEDQALVQDSIKRNRPLGSEPWVLQTARQLGIEQSLRPRGRPLGWRKKKNEEDKIIMVRVPFNSALLFVTVYRRARF